MVHKHIPLLRTLLLPRQKQQLVQPPQLRTFSLKALAPLALFPGAGVIVLTSQRLQRHAVHRAHRHLAAPPTDVLLICTNKHTQRQ
jgi:hypothetical protein